MFIGREKELSSLETLYANKEFQCAVIYGRRRVGKTTLINRFIEDKNAIFYMAMEGTAEENLRGLSKALLQQQINPGQKSGDQLIIYPEVNNLPSYSDYESLLLSIDQICMRKETEERLVLVIDEYPYLAVSYPAISPLLQKHIDQCWKNSSLFLILCGSSMSFMEQQVLGYKSPLYGRRTAQYKIQPFDFFEAREMLKSFSYEEQAILYGVTGGIPEYLSRIQQEKSLDENIIQLFFDPSGRLYEEPENLLKQELKNPATYHSIIQAIASGASRMNEIATKTGLESSGCSAQIRSLISLGLVRKETPITEKESSRKTIYRLEDSMFLFWYRFVRPNQSAVSRGLGEFIYQNHVRNQISDYMGQVYEDICRQYIYKPAIYVGLPIMISDLGRWWGNNPQKKCQEEIDLMAVVDRQAIFCECKWRNEQVSSDVIRTLEERSELFSFTEKWLYVFSKSGFTADAYEYIRGKERIVLIAFEEMLV